MWSHYVNTITSVGGSGQTCCYDDYNELLQTADTMYGGRPSRAYIYGKHPFKMRTMVSLEYFLVWTNNEFLLVRSPLCLNGFTTQCHSSSAANGSQKKITPTPVKCITTGEHLRTVLHIRRRASDLFMAIRTLLHSIDGTTRSMPKESTLWSTWTIPSTESVGHELNSAWSVQWPWPLNQTCRAGSNKCLGSGAQTHWSTRQRWQLLQPEITYRRSSSSVWGRRPRAGGITCMSLWTRSTSSGGTSRWDSKTSEGSLSTSRQAFRTCLMWSQCLTREWASKWWPTRDTSLSTCTRPTPSWWVTAR